MDQIINLFVIVITMTELTTHDPEKALVRVPHIAKCTFSNKPKPTSTRG